MIDPHIFREYDIRGIVGPQLDESVVATLARALAIFYKRNNAARIVVGYDARESSPVFSRIITEQLAASGSDVDVIGQVPTPVLYHSVFTRNYDGGVMITGSHNPADHNGFKIMLGRSALFGSQIQEIRKIVLETPATVEQTVLPGMVKNVDVLDDYIADILSKTSLGGRKLKVVVDGGNGMGCKTAVPIYERLGVELITLFAEPDASFPNHHPDPTVAENLEDLIDTVIEKRADVGIAFDGDADRIGVVDDTGRIIWGDELMIVFARNVLEQTPGSTIIGEVKCSQVLFDDIAAHGGKPIMWKAGHSLIKAKMKETGAALAGEMSGHIFFADRFYGFDDAAYAGCRLLEIISRSEKKLSELLSDIPKTFSTPELRVDCPDDVKFEVVRRVAEEFSAAHEVITIDGARIIFDQGWGLVRASNTQAILVLRFEAFSERSLAGIQNSVERKVVEAIKLATAANQH